MLGSGIGAEGSSKPGTEQPYDIRPGTKKNHYNKECLCQTRPKVSVISEPGTVLRGRKRAGEGRALSPESLRGRICLTPDI